MIIAYTVMSAAFSQMIYNFCISGYLLILLVLLEAAASLAPEEKKYCVTGKIKYLQFI